MDKRQCAVLQQCKELIIDNIDGKRILDPMVEAGVFSMDDDDEIRSNQTRKACAEKFFEKLLSSKHKNTYTTFKAALEENDTKYIVTEIERLEKTYETLPETSIPNQNSQAAGGRGTQSSSTRNFVYIRGNGNSAIIGGKCINVNINRR